jgi:transposase
VQPGASISIAAAARVTADNLTALGDPGFIPRLPATYSACEQVIGEAVARNRWEAVGMRAHTLPTKHRPGTCSHVAEASVTLYGQPYRAVVVHSSSQDQRRHKRLEREWPESSTTLETTVRDAAKQEYCCRADAEAAAEQRRALPSASHQVEVVVEERPQDGPGRPSRPKPRPVNARHDGLKPTLRERSEVIARKRQEAACFVRWTNVPTTGELAHRAGDVLRAYKDQHGVEQPFAFLNGPVIVNSLCLKKPERLEALGLVVLRALLLWRLVERALRVHVATTGSTFTGWDKKETQKPTAFMMMTQFAAVIVVKMGAYRQLAQPLSAVQQSYLRALGVPATDFTLPPSG